MHLIYVQKYLKQVSSVSPHAIYYHRSIQPYHRCVLKYENKDIFECSLSQLFLTEWRNWAQKNENKSLYLNVLYLMHYSFLHFEITVINHTQCHLYAWLGCFAMLLSNRTLIPIVVFEEKSVGYSVKTMQYYYAYGWNNLLEKYQKKTIFSIHT